MTSDLVELALKPLGCCNKCFVTEQQHYQGEIIDPGWSPAKSKCRNLPGFEAPGVLAELTGSCQRVK